MRPPDVSRRGNMVCTQVHFQRGVVGTQLTCLGGEGAEGIQ